MLAVLLTALVGCSTPLQGPPPGVAGQVAIANAVSALDPNKENSEAWQQTKGPYAWAYKVNVGKDAGQNRLMMYYVLQDYHQGNIPPLGTESDPAFVAKMNQISASYQQVDPNHPPVNSIDLVDPVPDGILGCDKAYRHPRLKDDVDHYLKLARDNHMLFFFDVDVGWSTPQHDLTSPLQPRNGDCNPLGDPYSLVDYLAQPDVNLAYDPEWDMRPGVIPGSDRGRTTAANINWMIDLLSNLVTTRHLPNKILVVHIFRKDEQYDNPFRPDPSQSWDKIRLKPGVTLIMSEDGQGAMTDKINAYNVIVNNYNGYHFFADQTTPLSAVFPIGFKVYIQIPCDGNHSYCEDPMTPQQVLALKPAPVMVQYQ